MESAESIFCRQCFTDDNAHVYLTRKVFIRLYESILESPEGEPLVNTFGSRLLIELCSLTVFLQTSLGLLSLIAGDGGRTCHLLSLPPSSRPRVGRGGNEAICAHPQNKEFVQGLRPRHWTLSSLWWLRHCRKHLGTLASLHTMWVDLGCPVRKQTLLL